MESCRGRRVYVPPFAIRLRRMGHHEGCGRSKVGHQPGTVVVEIGEAAITTEGDEVVVPFGLLTLEPARLE